MVLARLLERLEFIGEGSYSRVYEFGPTHVIKIPYDEDKCKIRKREQRIRQARFIVSWTQILHDKLGDVITPVSYHVGGAIVQRKVIAKSWYDLDRKRVSHAVGVDDLIDRAIQICRDMSPTLKFIIDSNESNFRYDEDGRVVDWFDPIAPPNRLFKSAEDMLSNCDNDFR